MARRWTTWPLMACLVVTCGAKGPKKGKKGEDEPAKPTVGWYQAEGWLGSCYYPPAWEDLGGGERKIKRNEAITEVMSQWNGSRNDGVSFEPRTIEGIETILLGYPEKVEQVVVDNYAQCEKAMTGGGTTAWEGWLAALPKKLVAGECSRPLDVTMYWYADIGMGWQGPASVCDDNRLRIKASSMDYYRIDDKGPWINADGDRDKPASGADYPCNVEGCYAGQLIMRFRGDDGSELIKPVGLELDFDPPGHGMIEFMINDTSYFNNEWKVERGVQHRTQVTYEPVE